MKRINSKLTFDHRDRFYILYGFGIDDIFIDDNHQEIDIEGALYEVLRVNGYNRIVYISPHRQVYFKDSDTQSMPEGMGFFKSGYSENQIPFDFMKSMSGPLEKKFVLKVADQPSLPGFENMGDLHAIRLLDSYMRDQQSNRTAVIFMQAETTIRYFEDQRILSGLVGEWLRLPSENHNICLMVFSAQNPQELADICQRVEIPEIRNMFARKNIYTSYQVINIEGPHRDEIERLIKSRLSNTSARSVNSGEYKRLAQMMEDENRTGRYWKEKLFNLPELTITGAKRAGWFTSTRNLDVPAEEQLNSLIGLEEVKKRIYNLRDWVKVYSDKLENTSDTSKPLLHMIFSGNPGTGKTTVARLVGEIFHDIGILRRGHLVEVNSSDLIAEFVGGTAIKTNSLVDSALGGVLFIDEAYALCEKERGGYGLEALDILVSRMENDRENFIVIAAGYPDKMRLFRKANPGLSRRFPEENFILFQDYTIEELWDILESMLVQHGLTMVDAMVPTVKWILEEMVFHKDVHFGNAGEIRNLVESLERQHAVRIVRDKLSAQTPLQEEDISNFYKSFLPADVHDLDDLMNELNHYIGLDEVKMSVRKLIRQQQFEALLIKKNAGYHSNVHRLPRLLFYGNPGTGKTSIARLVGKIFQSIGLLKKGHLIEVGRAELVAGYVGQTAIKTAEVIQKAIDGVLFIDEAYALKREGVGEFGQEAIDTLVKSMEEYADRLVIIAAGYEDEMRFFIHSNPGLISRFDPPIVFPDFSEEELRLIFSQYLDTEGYVLPEELEVEFTSRMRSEKETAGMAFGNARSVRQLFDQMKRNYAYRMMEKGEFPDENSLQGKMVFTFDDFPEMETLDSGLYSRT